MKQHIFLLFMCSIAILYSCSNEKNPTAKKTMQRQLYWEDSLEQGILYSREFIAHENKYIIDSIPFGITSKEYLQHLAKFYHDHEFHGKDVSALSAEEKVPWWGDSIRYKKKEGAYLLGNFKFRDVDELADSSGVYGMEIMGSPDYREGSNAQDLANLLTEYLKPRYGRPHKEMSENAREYQPSLQKLRDGRYFPVRSWTIGGKKIEVCIGKDKESVYCFLGIFKIENEAAARAKLRDW